MNRGEYEEVDYGWFLLLFATLIFQHWSLNSSTNTIEQPVNVFNEKNVLFGIGGTVSLCVATTNTSWNLYFHSTQQFMIKSFPFIIFFFFVNIISFTFGW